METPVCQRWRDRRTTYRPVGEWFDPAKHEVAPIDPGTARAFVDRHHYARSTPPIRRGYGLFRGPGLVGVAVASVPMRDCVLDPLPRNAAAELGRLVLLDDVAANAESWFVARCFALMARDGYAGMVSFADPVARTNAAGAVIFPGHVGSVYQALNAVYEGRRRPSILRLLPDGTVFSNRAAAKVRNRETGWRYAVDLLVAAGAPPPPDEDLDHWLPRALKAATRPLRHAGNFKYAWGFTRGAKRLLPASQPYPKLLAAPPHDADTGSEPTG